MPICGPKLSLCCTVISVWGVIQLVIMGGLFWSHSIALSEDIPAVEPEGHPDPKDPVAIAEWHEKYYELLSESYENNAKNCWICAGLYVGSLLFSLSQLYLHKRRQV